MANAQPQRLEGSWPEFSRLSGERYGFNDLTDLAVASEKRGPRVDADGKFACLIALHRKGEVVAIDAPTKGRSEFQGPPRR